MSRNQKVDSREGDVIKEVYPLEQGPTQNKNRYTFMYVGKLCCAYYLHFCPTKMMKEKNLVFQFKFIQTERTQFVSANRETGGLFL